MMIKGVMFVRLEELGETFAEIRKKARGLSQEEMKRKVGSSLASISGYETGKTPMRTDDIIEWANALGIGIRIAISLDEQDLVRLIDGKNES